MGGLFGGDGQGDNHIHRIDIVGIALIGYNSKPKLHHDMRSPHVQVPMANFQSIIGCSPRKPWDMRL